jgi:putative phosphoribosyl transferase
MNWTRRFRSGRKGAEGEGDTIDLPYNDRREAGRVLADSLRSYRGRQDTIVLALPRGGVPVGFEVARGLQAPLDITVVRKLGVPEQPELAMGAVALGGVRVVNRHVLSAAGITEDVLERVTDRELQELARREHAYRGDRPPPVLEDRCVILVDDGIATGATMRAAVAAVRHLGASEIVVAAPVASTDAILSIRPEADNVVCPAVVDMFLGISAFYRGFPQLDDAEVRAFLERAHALEEGHGDEGT